MLRTLLSVGLLAVSLPSVFAQAKLTGIETRTTDTGLDIVIRGEGLTAPQTSRVKGGTSLILEFPAALVGPRARQTVVFSGVEFVEVVQFTTRPLRSRVHIRLEPGVRPSIAQVNGLWTVRFAGRPVAKKTAVDSDRLAMDAAAAELTRPVKAKVSTPVANRPPVAKADPVGEFLTAATAQPTPVVTAAPIADPQPQADLPKLIDRAARPAPATTPAPAASPRPRPTISPEEAQMRQRVSLNFMATDIVQILRGLSQQVGVNIITSPEVSPPDKPVRLTMALNNVTVEEALSMITATTGLRYGRAGNTFVVAPNTSFPMVMRQIMERGAENYETRVVNLISGEAQQIREATLKAIPPDGRGGYYDIIVQAPKEAAPANPGGGTVPNLIDPGMMAGRPNLNAAAPQDAPAAPAGEDSAPPSKGRAFYVMLVGDPTRLVEVEDYVRNLDAKIAKSFSISRANTTGTVVVPIQSGQTERIKTMINRLLEDNPRRSDYSITETNVRDLQQGELSTRVLLMIGPNEELETLRRFATALDRDLCVAGGIAYADDAAGLERFYEVVELKHIEPTIAEFDLKGRVRGLWVTVLPDPVTPGIQGEAEGEKAATPTDQAVPGTSGGQAPKGEETKLTRQIGREPMRLVLRGTRQQIDEAKAYLALVDVAPRQVALELRVMELSREDALRVGLDWSVLAGSRANVIRFNQNLGDTPGSPGTISGDLNFGTKTNPVDGSVFAEQFSVLGTLDSISNNRNLIARPNALVSDGRTTDLFVGDTVRYIKSIQTSQNGITVLTDEIKVGVRFGIRARAGADGNVALDLRQNFSILTAFTPVPGGGQLPQTSDRETSLFVNMRTGETIALGGLILDQDRKNYSGIPILKDLPIIGRLFGRTNNSRVRTEIVFFLTAVTVDPGNRANAASPVGSLERSPRPAEDYKKAREEAEKRGLERRKQGG